MVTKHVQCCVCKHFMFAYSSEGNIDAFIMCTVKLVFIFLVDIVFLHIPKICLFIISFDSFSILQPYRLSKFAQAVFYPYAIPVCHLLIQMLVLFLVSFNVYATPSFSQLCSLLPFFPHTSNIFQFKFEYFIVLLF